MTGTEDSRRAEYVAGLHALAVFLAEHPDVPLPNLGDWGMLRSVLDGSRAEVDRIACLLGTEAREVDDGTAYEAARYFGPVAYRALAISSQRMARHMAYSTYSGVVEPWQASR